jgi:hypothetical protein
MRRHHKVTQPVTCRVNGSDRWAAALECLHLGSSVCVGDISLSRRTLNEHLGQRQAEGPLALVSMAAFHELVLPLHALSRLERHRG